MKSKLIKEEVQKKVLGLGKVEKVTGIKVTENLYSGTEKMRIESCQKQCKSSGGIEQDELKNFWDLKGK